MLQRQAAAAMARSLAALALAALMLLPAAAAQLPAPVPVQNPLAGDRVVHRNVDVGAELQAIAARHPEFATVESAGQTTMGQDLWTITLQHPNATVRYRAYLDGGHHGNEYMGTELVMAYLRLLVQGYADGDADVLAFLQEHAIKAMPLVNPDGNALDTRKNARQVDLNRNYPYEWGGEGSGGSPADGTYRGESPLSEPETIANMDAGLAFQPDAWVSMHTGIAEMYWPWSYTLEAPPDNAMFLAIERPFEEAGNNRLDAMQSAALYVAAGSIEDTIYGEHGIPGFVIEVHEDQFIPLYPGGISPAIADQLASLDWLMRNTGKLGAQVRVAESRLDGGAAIVRLANEGLGNATNGTLTLVRGGFPVQSVPFSIVAGGESVVRFEGVGSALGLRVEGRYPRLLVASSPTWEFEANVGEAGAPASAPLATPGFEALLAGLAAVAVASRRRR